MQRFRLVEIAEYLSVIGSVAGSAASVAFGQIIYTTVPMSLAIVLNLINRSQFERQIQARVIETVIE